MIALSRENYLSYGRIKRNAFFTPSIDRTIERVAIAALAAIATRGEGVSVTFAAITIFVVVAIGEELGAVGFGRAKEFHFETWLSRQLESCAFGSFEVREAVRSAGADLVLEDEEVLRLLIRATRSRGKFKSDGEIITLR